NHDANGSAVRERPEVVVHVFRSVRCRVDADPSHVVDDPTRAGSASRSGGGAEELAPRAASRARCRPAAATPATATAVGAGARRAGALSVLHIARERCVVVAVFAHGAWMLSFA